MKFKKGDKVIVVKQLDSVRLKLYDKIQDWFERHLGKVGTVNHISDSDNFQVEVDFIDYKYDFDEKELKFATPQSLKDLIQ